MYRKLALYSMLLLSISCSSQKKEFTSEANPKPINSVRIAWDYSSMQKLAPKGGYVRLLRLADKSIAVVSEDYGGNAFLIRSYDEGKSWTEPYNIFSHLVRGGVRVNISNPEIIQLTNGDILVACNYRPREQEKTPYAIAVRKSTDNGKAWGETQVIFEAEPRFGDGCWEPSFLQLPSGEVQVYFANEAPYTSSSEQEISVISSMDNGDSWSTLKTVCFRSDRRDGMPVARIIGDEIVVTIEDNNISAFKPYTVRCKIADNWSAPVLADSPERNYSLADKVDDKDYLGAPYFLVLPTGETLLSYQTNENRDENWELSTMEVAIGDSDAKNFSRRTQPFAVPLDKEAKWNSLALWDDKTVAALASSNKDGGSVAPWLIKGYILGDLKITEGKVNDLPIFVGTTGITNMRAGIGIDKENIYVKCKVNDLSLCKAAPEAEDGVYIFIDATNACLNKPDKGVFRLWCSRGGEVGLWEGKEGVWKEKEKNNIGAVVKEVGGGYEVELTIPKKQLANLNDKRMRFNAGFSDCTSGGQNFKEFIVHSDENASNTWLKVVLE